MDPFRHILEPMFFWLMWDSSQGGGRSDKDLETCSSGNGKSISWIS